jgi:hypothetical protein
MSMKSKGYMMALMALAAMSESTSHVERGATFIPDTEEYKRRARERQLQLLKKKGVQEFTIDGITVYARDYTNALRKVTNIKRPKIE